LQSNVCNPTARTATLLPEMMCPFKSAHGHLLFLLLLIATGSQSILYNSVLYLQQFGKDLVCVKHALWQTSTASCSIPWRPSTQDSKPVYREATATIHFPHHCAEGWIEKKIRKAWLSSEIFERDWLDEKADREKLEEIVLLDLIWTEIRLTGIS